MGMSAEFDAIERRVCTELDGLAEAGRLGGYRDTRWTAELKSRLTAVGNDLGYDVRVTSPDRRSSERLHDMCWLVVEEGLVREVELVLESEWKQDREEYDFDKLLLARAKHRVMVFTAM
ncbi:MAG: hypothetical protein ACE5HK_07845, partial [Candidatus Methylomirabilales bacterium]